MQGEKAVSKVIYLRYNTTKQMCIVNHSIKSQGAPRYTKMTGGKVPACCGRGRGGGPEARVRVGLPWDLPVAMSLRLLAGFQLRLQLLFQLCHKAIELVGVRLYLEQKMSSMAQQHSPERHGTNVSPVASSYTLCLHQCSALQL